MQSELSKTIDVADVKAQYDAQCKRVLSQKVRCRGRGVFITISVFVPAFRGMERGYGLS